MNSILSKVREWLQLAKQQRGGGLRYAGLMSANHLLNGVSGVLAMRWLEPVALGWWNSAQMVSIALDPFRIGVLNGMNREYPFLLGAGERERAHRMLETGLAHTLLTLVFCQFVIASGVYLLRDSDPRLVAGLIAAGAIWSLGYYTQFFRSMLRTSDQFNLTGKIELVATAVDATAVILVWRFGFAGLLVRAIATAVLLAVIYRRFQPVSVKPRFHWDAFRSMVLFGRNTYIMNYIMMIGANAERLLLLSAPEGVRLVGLYMPAVVCGAFMQVVPGAMHNYFYPRFVQEYGRDRNVGALACAIFHKIKLTSALMLPLGVGTALGIMLVVEFVLPSYREGLPAALIVCAAGPFFPLRICASYYAALHRWREYYVFSVLQAVAPFVAIWLFMRVVPPIIAAALGFVTAVAFSGSMLLWLTVQHARLHAGTSPPAASAQP
jgi:hypothetical protein